MRVATGLAVMQTQFLAETAVVARPKGQARPGRTALWFRALDLTLLVRADRIFPA